MSATPEIHVDQADENLIVAIDSEGISIAAHVESEADSSVIQEASEDLLAELAQSAGTSGGEWA